MSGSTIFRDDVHIPMMALLPNGCWLWTRTSRGQGYGRWTRQDEWRNQGAHRAVWEQLNGPVPVGRELDHLCRERLCVNPAHLEVVTTRENVLRGEGPPARNARKTHCYKGHSLKDAIVTRGRRVCRQCNREKSRRLREQRIKQGA